MRSIFSCANLAAGIVAAWLTYHALTDVEAPTEAILVFAAWTILHFLNALVLSEEPR